MQIWRNTNFLSKRYSKCILKLSDLKFVDGVKESIMKWKNNIDLFYIMLCEFEQKQLPVGIILESPVWIYVRRPHPVLLLTLFLVLCVLYWGLSLTAGLLLLHILTWGLILVSWRGDPYSHWLQKVQEKIHRLPDHPLKTTPCSTGHLKIKQ